MKDALLDLNATVATVLDVATWMWIGSAVFLTGCAAWAVIHIGRRVFDAFTRANQTIRELISQEDVAAHLNTCWQQYADDTRKETQ
jgi:ABC-type nickel/cobalt efflux system permease component RcnA